MELVTLEQPNPSTFGYPDNLSSHGEEHTQMGVERERKKETTDDVVVVIWFEIAKRAKEV